MRFFFFLLGAFLSVVSGSFFEIFVYRFRVCTLSASGPRVSRVLFLFIRFHDEL